MKKEAPKDIQQAIYLTKDSSTNPPTYSVVVATLSGDRVLERTTSPGLNYYLAVDKLKRTAADLFINLREV